MGVSNPSKTVWAGVSGRCLSHWVVFPSLCSWDRFWSPESRQSDKSDGAQILNHAGNVCLQSKSGTFRNMLVSTVSHNFHFEGESSPFLFFPVFQMSLAGLLASVCRQVSRARSTTAVMVGFLELCPLYRGWNLSQQWLKVTRGHQVVCRRCDWGLVKPNKGKDTRHSTSLVNSSVHQWERRDLLVWVKEQEEQENGERLHAASSALDMTERCLNNFHEYLMMVTSVTFEHCCWNEPEYWCSTVLQDCCCPRWCQMID